MNEKIGFGMVLLGVVLFGGFAISTFGLEGFSTTESTGETIRTPVFADVECEVGPITQTSAHGFGDNPYKQNTWHNFYKVDMNTDRNSPEFAVQVRDNDAIHGFLGAESDAWYEIIVKTKNPNQSDSEYKQVRKFSDHDGRGGQTTNGGSYSWTTIKGGIDKGKDIRVIFKTPRYLGQATQDQVQARLEYERYDLKTDSPNLPQTITEGSCDVSNMNAEWYGSDMDDAQESGKLSGTELGFGKSFSVVTGTTPVTEPANAIDTNNDDVEDKYITRVTPRGGYYYDIEKTNQGTLLVDSRNENGPLSNIVCSPASPYCSSDGTEEISPEEGDGSKFSGGTTGYLPTNSGDRVCEYNVVNGEMTKDNCKDIPDCGANEILDQNYACTDKTDVDDDDSSDIPLWLVAIAAFAGTMIFGGFIIIVIAVAVKTGGK